MPVRLKGSCRCGACAFEVDSHTPYPYMRCYCSICRKLAGGGGYAINIMGVAQTLTITGAEVIGKISVEKDGAISPMSRSFCTRCGTAVWGWHPEWPDLLHPFASAIDTDLPVPPTRVHMMLADKAPWVQPDIREGDLTFDGYPDQSIEDWHKTRNLWID
ncbi:GFA family protein [Mameliella alba]|nr:GFA family protein [Mameliella alba]MBY6168935.1 GFA family protein [Mameliella alba]MBY6173844.1 GFA family protein [Mameliella alba]